MVSASATDDDHIKPCSLGLNVDLPTVTMYHWQQPLLAIHELAELFQHVVVPLKQFTVPVNTFIRTVKALLLGMWLAMLPVRL